MEVRDALDQLDRIHDQLTKTEVYRGFRVPAVALVGCVGLFAAVIVIVGCHGQGPLLETRRIRFVRKPARKLREARRHERVLGGGESVISPSF